MPKFIITPEEIEIIKELRKDAAVCKCSIREYYEQLFDLAVGHMPDRVLSNWSIGEKGEIIKPKPVKE